VLGPDRARAAAERGAAMSPATATEYLLLLTAPAQPAGAADPGQLTAGERELVTPVAQGRTDTQIAAQLPERPPHQDAHPIALRDRRQLGLDAAAEDRVGRLLGAEPLQAAPLGDPLGFDDVGGGRRGGADRADLAAVDQVGERGQRFLDVGGGVRPVELVQVNVVGLCPGRQPGRVA
jgi:hypothetical protein